MDILRTPWIPTDIGVVTPLEVLNEAHAIVWQRGDWDAATFCLLHALVQTAVILEPERCADRDAWESLLTAPPHDLNKWLDLDLGDRPWECPNAEGLLPIGRLLPESPGENTVKKAADIGRWAQEVRSSLTLPESTVALISDNLWGTRIGQGHRQGARGEQPLTTWLESSSPTASLWENVWLNVIPSDAWRRLFGRERKTFEFPWKQTLTNGEITPQNAHSLSVLWQMPRRWRLAEPEQGLVRSAHRQNGGRHYVGWERKHPLTPYFAKPDGTWVAAKVSPHTGFDDWAAIALQQRPKTQPAAVVVDFVQTAWRGEPLRLRCCGWALDASGASGTWVDHVVPFYQKNVDQADLIEKAVVAAETQRKRLAGVLGNARRGLQRHSGELYPLVESSFYRRVSVDDWSGWEAELRHTAHQLFWRIANDHRVDAFITADAARRL